jgi:type VII secretion-associated serine protease mycosin
MNRVVIRAVAIFVATFLLAIVAAPATPVWADSVRDRQWHLAFLNVTEAHQYTRGAGVIVAVLDSGVDGTHPDLVGNVLPGIDVEPGAGGNGWSDADGHGTGMAGLIGAHGHGPGNSSGVLGIAPEATILPVKDGDRHSVALIAAIDWATANGAKVISISQGSATNSRLEQRAIENAIAHDIVVVAGVGNIPGTSVDFPAAYPGVVAVAGVDQQGNHAQDSITGPQVVLSAPDIDIMNLALNHGYMNTNGTSDATAIVAGAAALVRAKYPNLSATEVVHRLTATAIDKGAPGRDSVYGYGIVNLVGALTADVPPLETPAASSPPTAAPETDKPTNPWVVIGVGVALAIVAILGFAVLRRRSRL